MLGFSEMRLAGHRGLMQLAQRRGDGVEAVANAEAAYNLAKTTRWAWRALLEARLAAGDWDAALSLAKDALDRKIVSPIVAERARAALMAASAASREFSTDPKLLEQTLDLASQAAKLKPDFAPGVLTAARRLAADGKAARAAQLIEQAWKLRPHPGLALFYRDLITNETPRDRARRLEGLAELNSSHHESQILLVEKALLAGDVAGARRNSQPLDQPGASARVCGLMARVAMAAHDSDEARSWISRAASAPCEPDWSDIDPEGRAFAYGSGDWGRLVSHYAETGDLLHPRLERGERVMSDLPDLPVAYRASTPFFASDGAGLLPPIPDDPGPEEDESALAAPRPAPSPTRRRRTVR
jgi:HemY protein